MAQIFIVRFSNSDPSVQTQALNIWSSFLSNLSAKIIASENEDITLEFSSFVLFLFHNLTAENRDQILIQLSNTLIDLDSKIADKNVKTPLLISRLLFLFDYILNHFDEPSNTLIKLIDQKLFNFKSDFYLDHENEHQEFLRLLNPS